MSGRKRTISIRKILQTLLTGLVVAGVAVAVTAADKRQQAEAVRGVQVHISNAGAVQFLDEASVKSMLLTSRHLDPSRLPLRGMDLGNMEAIAKSNPWVSDAQVYIDNQRVMHISLTQRVPIVRIFDNEGSSYYLDTALKVVPLSDRYVHYAPIVTGLPKLRPDSTGESIRAQAYYVARIVEADPFWRAQVAQIAMLGEREFELVPVIGRQHLLIGDTAQLRSKLSRLLTFYKNVLNKIGYDKYDTLDARFSGQIVASPALSWKAPVDKTLSDAVWAKAIIESAPKEPEAANQGDLDPASPPAPAAVPQTPPSTPSIPRPATDPRPNIAAPRPAPRQPDNRAPARERPERSTAPRPAERPRTSGQRPAATSTNRTQPHP